LEQFKAAPHSPFTYSKGIKIVIEHSRLNQEAPESAPTHARSSVIDQEKQPTGASCNKVAHIAFTA
jgi:hypothetical protein